MRSRLTQHVAILLWCLIATARYVSGSPEPGEYRTLTQPDGTVLDVYSFLDEFASYLVAEGGLVAQSDEDGYYYYSRFDGLVDERFTFRSTAYLPGVDDKSPEVGELQEFNSSAMSVAAHFLRYTTGHLYAILLSEPGEIETLTQPDGATFLVLSFFDKFASYLYAVGGLVRLNEEDGFYYYARFQGLVDGRFIFLPTEYRALASLDDDKVYELHEENMAAMSAAAEQASITSVGSVPWSEVKSRTHMRAPSAHSR